MSSLRTSVPGAASLRAPLLRLAALLAPALLLTAPLAAQRDTAPAGVRIGLTYQTGSKPGVMVLPVAGGIAPAGDSLRRIMARDLDYGDRVTVLGEEAANAAAPTGGALLNYELIAKLGAAAAVQVTLTATGAHVAVHDVGAKRVLQVRDFALPAGSPAGAWRAAAHAISDEVERWITGIRGIASTRVAFVRDGRIYVVDADGENERAVSEGSGALSPAWHPDGRHLAWSVLTRDGSRIAIRDLAGQGTRFLPAGSWGLDITPVFSRAEPGTIAFSRAQAEGMDIVMTDWAGGTNVRRVTIGRGTDNVGPTFSPDGRRLAFTSGRPGHPEVYITDVDGSNTELLTPYDFGDQSYRASPDWSPDGRAVAFQSRIGGRFQVMTIALRDRAVKQHTSEAANEDPSWAPDARHLVLTSTRTGSRQLFVLDTESGRVRQLTRGAPARLAAWSPSLAPAP